MATVRLKRLGERNLEAALAKAEQYRALNEPEEAESICRDVLDEAPEDQHEIHPVVADPLFERVEDGGLGVFIRFPVEPVEVEHALEGLADVLANRAADHEGAAALGELEQVLKLGLADVLA